MPLSARRLAATALAVATAGAVVVPVAHAADHTQQLNLGAELLRQPTGSPWEINLLVGATMAMSDNSIPKPVTHMRFSFPSGARVNADAFKTCAAKKLARTGPSTCPKGSIIGKGTAVAWALQTEFHADMTVFNGPGNNRKRAISIYAKLKEIPTLTVQLDGTLRKTSGKYGYVLDVPVPTIAPIGPGSEASITGFETTVGAYARKKGKKVPYIEAPTSCRGAGWPFLGAFDYADGAKATVSAHISCTIRATAD
jgi:hypothetical protein